MNGHKSVPASLELLNIELMEFNEVEGMQWIS